MQLNVSMTQVKRRESFIFCLLPLGKDGLYYLVHVSGRESFSYSFLGEERGKMCRFNLVIIGYKT